MIPSPYNPRPNQHLFSSVPHVDLPRSKFTKDYTYKSCFYPGFLYPIMCEEILPGDSYKVTLSSVTRFTTLLVPFMDSMYMNFYFFFVPNRLVWENWQRFMGERDPDPDSSIDYNVPVVEAPGGGWTQQSLADYFGIPTKIDNIDPIALPFRAYNLIWNQFFRSQDLQDSLDVDKDDGPDSSTQYSVQRKCKLHDYFTSCLPNPQKADDPIDLPLGTVAPVITGSSRTFVSAESPMNLWVASTGVGYGSARPLVNDTSDQFAIDTGGSVTGAYTSVVPRNLWADLTNATAATINSLREAFQLQRMLEKDARSGTRYTEIIQGHFGVTSPDFRLQRPEYLGGGKTRIQVDAVPSTENATAGELGAIGYNSQSGIGFNKSFTEHGYVIGLACATSVPTYQQGLHRMWSRSDRYDFYFPSLAHLGEQEVYNREIYAQGDANDALVFGYQERWAEMRYGHSMATGHMRSNHTASLDGWHLAQEFSSLPGLNASFIAENPPIDRVVLYTAQPTFRFDGYFSVTAARCMPLYSVPGLIDHF